MHRVVLLFCLFFITQWSIAQVTVSAEVDSLHMLIGDQMPLHLRVKTQPGVRVKDIDLSGFDKVENLEVVRITPIDTIANSGGIELYQDIFFTAFDSGYYQVPSIPVSFSENGTVQTMTTNTIPIEVRTIETDSTFLAPNKDIIEEPFKWTDVLPFALGLLAFVGLLVLGYYLFGRKKDEGAEEEKPIIKRPAHEIAIEKLDALKEAKLWQQGQVKAYQSELTYIVREYLENRYEVQALESTTDKILKDLKAVDLPEGFSDKLREMLQLADMVKFAKAEPPIEAHDRLLGYAEDFVMKTKKRIELETTTEKSEIQ